jgi:hypothetical protein
VNEPPDYILNALWLSLFGGTKNNAILDNGKLYLGIKNETFQAHFTVNNWTTPQSQVSAGYLLYAQPFATSSFYEEIFDYGTILPSTTVGVTLDFERVGSGGYEIDISTSADGTTYSLNSNVSRVSGSTFRYVKVKIRFAGTVNDAFIINAMEVKLDSKIKSDSGKTIANESDATGTIVNFNKTFVDIVNLTITPLGTTRKTFVCDFEDLPNPTFFKVYIYDMNGNRITSDFTWSAEGY